MDRRLFLQLLAAMPVLRFLPGLSPAPTAQAGVETAAQQPTTGGYGAGGYGLAAYNGTNAGADRHTIYISHVRK